MKKILILLKKMFYDKLMSVHKPIKDNVNLFRISIVKLLAWLNIADEKYSIFVAGFCIIDNSRKDKYYSPIRNGKYVNAILQLKKFFIKTFTFGK